MDPTNGRVSEAFRVEHLEIRRHLEHVREKVGSLAGGTPAQRKKTMASIVQFLKEHIRPHAEWEERVLYPVVDRYAGSGPYRFTATMRHEHRIVGRWIDELAAEAALPKPDTQAFARRADQLLGLITAHFEEEEDVLLPVLDRAMTPEQFQHEVMDKVETHGSPRP